MPQTDWLKEHAAKGMAERIAAYWRKQGKLVNTRVEPVRGKLLDGHAFDIHQIRSDMVGGLPSGPQPQGVRAEPVEGGGREFRLPQQVA